MKNNTTVDLIGITQIDFIKFRCCPIKIIFEGLEIDPYFYTIIKNLEDEEW